MAEQMTPQEAAEWEAWQRKQLGKNYKPPATPAPVAPPAAPTMMDKQRALSGALRRREQEAGNP